MRLLLALRQVPSLTRWRRVLYIFAQEVGITPTAADRLAWGLAVGYRKAPQGVPVRGLEPLAWGETHMLRQHMASQHANQEASVANVAGCLGLEVQQVQGLIQTLAAQGRRTLT